MRFVVVGAGAIGGYVGACLARGSTDGWPTTNTWIDATDSDATGRWNVTMNAYASSRLSWRAFSRSGLTMFAMLKPITSPSSMA